MAGSRVRLPKACEHCRRTKKRCHPPFPCQSCSRSGLSCVVRSKARPLRTPKRSLFPIPSTEEDAIPPSADPIRPAASSQLPSSQGPVPASGPKARDPFDVIRQIVSQEAYERQHTEPLCELPEPLSSSASNMVGFGTLSQSNISAVADIMLPDIEQMLDAAGESRGLPIELLDLLQLRQAAEDLFHHSPHHPHLGHMALPPENVPLDRLSLLFATLALHNFPNSNPQIMPAFLELSTMMMDNYVGESTLDLVSALFIQHTCVLRTGTGNRGRALIANAVQVAHDLGIHHLDHSTNPQALRIYLMIYFADQYCALTHNTPPCIKTTDISPDLFNPLLVKYPRLQRFVRLVSLNGQVLESLHTGPHTYDLVVDIESIMGRVCARIGKPKFPELQSGETFESYYEVLVQIHVFWSRIILRAPLLLSETHWISSLSVCLRAAQMLLSIYFDISSPAITLMATTALQGYDDALRRQLQSIILLPPTWRQVRRITCSVFVTIYAYWKGEASYEEASRSAAMAVALLEFQRTRWRGDVQPAISTVRSFVTSSGLSMRPFIQQLVPDATAAYLAIVSEEAIQEPGDLTTEEGTRAEESLEQLDSRPTTAWWVQNDLGNIFDAVSMYDSIFGLWEEPVQQS